MLSKGTIPDLQGTRGGILGGLENDAPGHGVEESKDDGDNLLAIAEEVKAQLLPGQEATVMSPEDIGRHLTQPLATSTPKQTHAWLMEHDEQYRIAFFANLKTRNTRNLKKPPVETVTSGSVQESNKEVTQPVIEMFSGSDPDATKNRNNNGHPTADGTNKSPWSTVTRRTSSGDSVSNGPFFSGNVPVTSQNRNNQSTDGGTDQSVSTDTWFNQHIQEAKDMYTEATKKIESGGVSATR
jgi:hypothetical protein